MRDKKRTLRTKSYAASNIWCILKERAANGQDADPITAGPVEKALNADIPGTISKLTNSETFKEAIGKVTPARIESFLKGNEARGKEFESIVLNTMFPAKVNAPENQPIQQPKLEVAQPKAEPKVLGGP